jgi:hypothetical protein
VSFPIETTGGMLRPSGSVGFLTLLFPTQVFLDVKTTSEYTGGKRRFYKHLKIEIISKLKMSSVRKSGS